MIVILVTSLFYEALIFSEICIKRTPSGNAVVSANTGCPPNTGFDR